MTPGLSPGCVIALLGACADEREALQRALATRLTQRGIPVTRVDDPLPAWIATHGEPDAGTLLQLANLLSAQITQAAGHSVVMAGNSALGLLAHAPDPPHLLRAPRASNPPPNDGDMSAAMTAAVTAHRHYAFVMLVGLNPAPPGASHGALPGAIHGETQGAQALLAARDTRLRDLLAATGRPFPVIHGRATQRLANAWTALLVAHEEADSAPAPVADARTPWTSACDKCSDPVCEHQMFRRLIAERGNPAA